MWWFFAFFSLFITLFYHLVTNTIHCLLIWWVPSFKATSHCSSFSFYSFAFLSCNQLNIHTGIQQCEMYGLPGTVPVFLLGRVGLTYLCYYFGCDVFPTNSSHVIYSCLRVSMSSERWRILFSRRGKNKNASRQQEKLTLCFDFLCSDFHKDSAEVSVDSSVEHPIGRSREITKIMHFLCY